MKSFVRSAAALLMAALPIGEALALTASQAQIADAKRAVIKVADGGYRHHRHYGGPVYSNWCAYNCRPVSPCYRGCLGEYHYSRYRYDDDIPLRHRYETDARPSENLMALVYPRPAPTYLWPFEQPY